MASRRYRAFTLVELLVVIAIIGILVSLLLPAIQAAREAARRTECTNNLKQIGLALHNYHDTYGRFPPSGILYGDPGVVPHQLPYHHTWLVMILPFMEQNSLYADVNKEFPIWNDGTGQPQAVARTQVDTLLCPSSLELDLGQTRNMAYTNYAASEGYHWWPTAYLHRGHYPSFNPPSRRTDFSGLFTITKSNKESAITDGTSNTVAVAEVNSTGYKWGPIRTSGTGAPRNNTGERVFRAAFVWTGRYGWCCQRGQFRDPAGGTKWWFPAGAPYPFSPTYLSAWGPNANWPGASSRHPGGINVALADGSGRAVNNNIDWGVWAKINGIADQYAVEQY